jgi:cobalamin 5'-phosphate synthase/cobalamin synthase
MQNKAAQILSNIAKGFSLAVSMLTTLPFFRVHDFFSGINGYAVMFYPLVGFLLGFILYLFHFLLAPYLPLEHLSILLFALWVVLTGALHLDGFSDTVDALFVPKERAAEVMKDPHVGAMGMGFSAVFLILKASALWHLEALWALPIILMFSRFTAVLAIYFLPYIRENGMSTLAKQEFTLTQLLFSSLMVGLAALLFPSGLLLLGTALVGLLLFTFWFKRRFGGFSGDLYGFMIEMSELLLLHVLLIGALL